MYLKLGNKMPTIVYRSSDIWGWSKEAILMLQK